MGKNAQIFKINRINDMDYTVFFVSFIVRWKLNICGMYLNVLSNFPSENLRRLKGFLENEGS